MQFSKYEQHLKNQTLKVEQTENILAIQASFTE